MMEELTRSCKYALDKAEIGIPFPQMDVNFTGFNPSAMTGSASDKAQSTTVQ